tara:strand:- start:2485 stop:2850 length:366 start_codon:yes stop_codon:yes gene_type:complete
MKNLSPSLEIYKFPVTAITSIINRVTGIALSGLFVCGGLVCLFEKEHHLKSLYNKVPEEYKQNINYIIITPAVYHTLGGIRHLIWDYYPNEFLNNKNVKKSSLLLISMTFPITHFCEKYLL